MLRFDIDLHVDMGGIVVGVTQPETDHVVVVSGAQQKRLAVVVVGPREAAQIDREA